MLNQRKHDEDDYFGGRSAAGDEQLYVYLGGDAEPSLYLRRDSELPELMQAASDYEHGMNYALHNFRYRDYKLIMSWIEDQLQPGNETRTWRLGPMCHTRYYGSPEEFAELEKKVETVYKDYEEGDHIVAFPEGERWSPQARFYSKESSLKELELLRESTLGNPDCPQLAIIPVEKQYMLDCWIAAKKDQSKDAVIIVVGEEHEEVYTSKSAAKDLQELRLRASSGDLALTPDQKDLLDKWYSTQLKDLIRRLEAKRDSRDFLPEI